MVLLFLPAVRELASVFVLAAFPVELDLLVTVPVRACLPGVVFVYVRLAAEVLPVVSVLTLLSEVFLGFGVEGAPNCFEMEHVEVIIMFHFVEDVNAELLVGVCKGAEVSEIAVYTEIRGHQALKGIT